MECENQRSIDECGMGRDWWHWMFCSFCHCGHCWLATLKYRRM